MPCAATRRSRDQQLSRSDNLHSARRTRPIAGARTPSALLCCSALRAALRCPVRPVQQGFENAAGSDARSDRFHAVVSTSGDSLGDSARSAPFGHRRLDISPQHGRLAQGWGKTSPATLLDYSRGPGSSCNVQAQMQPKWHHSDCPRCLGSRSKESDTDCRQSAARQTLKDGPV